MRLRRAAMLALNATVGLLAGCLVIKGDLVIFKQRESISDRATEATTPIGVEVYPTSQPSAADLAPLPDILRGGR